MDICFKALQRESTGRLVSDAAAPVRRHPHADAERRQGAQRSSALGVAAAAPYSLGDIAGLTTWFCMAVRSEGRGAEAVCDVAA